MRSGRTLTANRGAIVAAALVLVAAAAAAAAAWTGPAAAAVIPLPPRADRSVHDPAGVLSAQAIDLLERRHKELFDKTGVALVVITVKRLEDENLSDFAVRVGSEWGAGRKGQDRGIVAAVTTDEPHIYVATGYGVEGFLPDGRVGGILDRDVVAHLKKRDFDTAMLNLSAALVAACAEEYGVTIGDIGPDQTPPRGKPQGIPPVVLILLILVAVLFRIFLFPSLRRGRRGVWYGGGFGGGFGGGGFGGGGGGGFGGFGGGGFGGGGAGR